MNAMLSPSRETFEQLGDVFIASRQDLERVLRRYEIPASAAAPLLEETVIELLYKAETVEDFAGWLCARLRNQCRRYWVDRRRRFFKAAGWVATPRA